MRKHYYLLPFFALGLIACTDNALDPSDKGSEQNPGQTTTAGEMLHMKLAAIASDQNRVSYQTTTRADGEESVPGTLRLIASIENPEKQVFSNTTGNGGRMMSATCVYYDDKTETYYATYHLQGNNYATDLKQDVSGFIETFKVAEDGSSTLINLYKSDDSDLDFDFNHLYFDSMDNHLSVVTDSYEDRIIAVGHLAQPTSTGKTQTKAIIAKLNLEGEPSFDYKVVYTGDKILDENGKSLGAEDAQDVNAVVRAYDTYYLATRKGIALLRATDNELFNPSLDYDKKNYFVKTKNNGSVKHVAKSITNENMVSFLYLTEDFNHPFYYEDEIKAELVRMRTCNLQAKFIDENLEGSYGFFGMSDNCMQYISDNNFLDYAELHIPLDHPVSPVDGKNVLFMIPSSENNYFVALGKGGLYYMNDNSHGMYGKESSGYLDYDFGNRPVNGVYADEVRDNENHNGFIYVVNGSKLTIFNRYKLDEVASFNLPQEETGSANYVIARQAKERNADGNFDRIITVAYGQAGLKVFRFTPKSLW